MERPLTANAKSLSYPQPSSLYKMMPSAFHRRFPRIPFVHRLLSSRDQSISMTSSGPRKELIPFQHSQEGFSESSLNDLLDVPRPLTADSFESVGSSASSVCGQITGSPASDADALAVSHYETSSGLGWNRVVPAFNILRSAGCEAQQPRPDSRLIRSLYISGLTYLLEALPSDLTSEEVETIQDHLPHQLQSSISSRSDGPSGRQFATRKPATHPSYLHRLLSTLIIYGFLFAQLLLPYIKTVLQKIYQYERTHRITERLLVATLGVADELATNGANARSTAVNLRQGKIAAAVSSIASWWLEGIAGGIYDGVGEGMIILSGQRPQTVSQRSK